MERHDSLATISSLAAYSEASSSEDESSADPQAPTFGADKPASGDSRSNENSKDSQEKEKSPELSPAMSPAPAAAAPSADDDDVMMGGAISDDEEEHKSHHSSSSSGSTDGSSSGPRRPVTPIEVHSMAANSNMKPQQSLVSYLPMDEEEEEDGEREDSDDDSQGSSATPSEGGNIELSSSGHERSLSLSVQNLKEDEISIPPEPPGVCSRDLQASIERMYARVKRQGINMNQQIQNRKDFRNPSIYEKLVSFMNIDEQGTNFPSEIFDPKMWGPESFYDNLAKIQKEEMDKREKEKKDRTKVEFITATKKDGSKGDKRKSKWDQNHEPNRPPISVTSATNIPTISVTTSSSSGAKTTVISAVGVIKKPKLESK